MGRLQIFGGVVLLALGQHGIDKARVARVGSARRREMRSGRAPGDDWMCCTAIPTSRPVMPGSAAPAERSQAIDQTIMPGTRFMPD